jgi:N-formylglutamate deformylase
LSSRYHQSLAAMQQLSGSSDNMNSQSNPWLAVTSGQAPLLLCMPHTGTDIPPEVERGFVDPWLARRDTDWWIDHLYGFAQDLGASLVRTAISRSVIDMNRDPSGASLYPGQATTELCPTTTFDGQPLYRDGAAPDTREIARRRTAYFEPYHQAIAGEIARLRALYPAIVVYDCHSIRSRIPRLFEGELPNFNLGTFSGASCAPALTHTLEALCDASGLSRVTNGRFKGGYTTRHYGKPENGVHAVQMELACRGYMAEPQGEPDDSNWPTRWDAGAAERLRQVLEQLLIACLRFCRASR